MVKKKTPEAGLDSLMKDAIVLLTKAMKELEKVKKKEVKNNG